MPSLDNNVLQCSQDKISHKTRQHFACNDQISPRFKQVTKGLIGQYLNSPSNLVVVHVRCDGIQVVLVGQDVDPGVADDVPDVSDQDGEDEDAYTDRILSVMSHNNLKLATGVRASDAPAPSHAGLGNSESKDYLTS